MSASMMKIHISHAKLHCSQNKKPLKWNTYMHNVSFPGCGVDWKWYTDMTSAFLLTQETTQLEWDCCSCKNIEWDIQCTQCYENANLPVLPAAHLNCHPFLVTTKIIETSGLALFSWASKQPHRNAQFHCAIWKNQQLFYLKKSKSINK